MSLKAAELRAIKWYCDEKGLIPQLLVPPMQMNFKKKSDGEDVQDNLENIKLLYSANKKEEAKMARQQKKAAEAQQRRFV